MFNRTIMRYCLSVGLALLFLFNYKCLNAKVFSKIDLQDQENNLPRNGFIIIPAPPPNVRNPISLKSEEVKVTIKEGLADVERTQIFHNNCLSTIEGFYIFPLPEGSVISNFAMYMGNNKINGQVLSAKEAKKIYEEIVRKRRDPSLLEYIGQSLFQARIFPILGSEDKRIDLKYNQPVKFDNNTFRFIYPLNMPEGGPKAGVLNFSLNIKSDKAITNIYSPTHKIRIDQKNDNEAFVTLSLENRTSEKDFILYYSVTEKNLGVSLITYKPYSNENGYFCLNLSPKYEIDKKNKMEKDIVFVLDASGSMLGEKIDQAKAALKYCLNNLNSGDRFAIIDFSNDVRKFNQDFLKFDSKSKDDALYYIDKLEATGGTNLNEAILTALKLNNNNNGRPTMLILLTDGLPTVGIKDPNEIMNNIQKSNSNNMRIFTFGVGFDVDVFLLDKISNENFGSSNYVRPEENLETEVSNFYSKISTPVLSDINLSFSNVDAVEMYPKRIPDLFYKGQITIFGRYKNNVHSVLSVDGKVENAKQKFSFDVYFEEKERTNDFIANLWANRKVGYLLDQIRMNGENQEMIDEIIMLAKKYGIVTPYTSYLVTEEETGRIGMNQPLMKRDNIYDTKAGGYRAIDERKKENMVSQSIAIQGLQSSDRVTENQSYKIIKGKTFILKKGIWVDTQIEKQSQEESITIHFGSDEYFDLIYQKPEIIDYLKVSDKVSFSFQGKIYNID